MQPQSGWDGEAWPGVGAAPVRGLLVVVYRLLIIPFEESFLSSRFGDEYRDMTEDRAFLPSWPSGRIAGLLRGHPVDQRAPYASPPPWDPSDRGFCSRFP